MDRQKNCDLIVISDDDTVEAIRSVSGTHRWVDTQQQHAPSHSRGSTMINLALEGLRNNPALWAEIQERKTTKVPAQAHYAGGSQPTKVKASQVMPKTKSSAAEKPHPNPASSRAKPVKSQQIKIDHDCKLFH
jgi:hypothetical protein